jgi:hypothetical protein
LWRAVRRAAAIALVLAAPSCAPADAVPSPDADARARIARVASLLREDAAPGVDVLAAQLDDLCRFPPAVAATRSLAAAVIEALGDVRLAQTESDAISMQLYTLMNGGFLTRAQLQTTGASLDARLARLGVSDHTRGAVRAGGTRVAREERSPRRDWW